jgi:flagellar protein FlaF
VYNNAAQAYQSVEKATINGRELEAKVLTNAAIKLKRCQDNWDDSDKSGQLNEALRLNQKIWSIFQTELLSPENPLDQNLRTDLLRLSLFVDRRIMDIMAFPAPEKLTAIISINNNIAAGLKGIPVD